MWVDEERESELTAAIGNVSSPRTGFLDYSQLAEGPGRGVQATRAELRDFIRLRRSWRLEDCFTIPAAGAPRPEHVAHLTSVRVMRKLAQAAGLDAGQNEADAAVASTDPLVIVKGAVGSGKPTMLGVAIAAAQQEGRPARVGGAGGEGR